MAVIDEQRQMLSLLTNIGVDEAVLAILFKGTVSAVKCLDPVWVFLFSQFYHLFNNGTQLFLDLVDTVLTQAQLDQPVFELN